MNKKIVFGILFGTVLVMLIVITIIYFNVTNNPTKKKTEEVLPQPTHTINEQHEGKENEDGLAKWTQQMHLAAPGSNWQKMDAELRQIKANQRALLMQSKVRSGENDTLANGHLIGQWNELGSYNTSGRIRATEIDFATNTLYAFSQGGNLWKSDLYGTNWTSINDNFNFQSALFLRKLGDRLMVAADAWGTQGFYYTENEGAAWTQTTGLENVAEWGYIADACMLNNATHTIYLLAYEWDNVEWNATTSIFKSTNLGNSFSKVISYDDPTFGNADRFALWSSTSTDSVAYFIENNHFNKLNNLGIPELISTLPYDAIATPLLCGYEDETNTHFYVGFNQTESTQFFCSNDKGETWIVKGELNENYFSKNSFNCKKSEEGYLFFGGLNSFRSIDGGNSWILINDWAEYYENIENRLHADIPFIESFYNQLTAEEVTLISTDGGLYKSTNGNNYTNITLNGMRNAQYYDVFTYKLLPEILFAGAQDQGLQRSLDHIGFAYNFVQLISGDYGHFASKDGGDHLWMIYPGFTTLILDAASSANMHFGDFPFYNNLWMPPLMEDPYDDNVAYVGGGTFSSGAHLFKVTYVEGSDLNYEEMPYNFSPLNDANISALGYSLLNKNYRYVLMSNGQFFYSTNDGIDWNSTASFNGPGSHYFYGAAIAVSNTNPEELYIAGSGYSSIPAYFSNDHGQTFFALNNGLPNTLVYDLALSNDDSLLFAATEVGPYVYVKSENMWYDIAAEDAPYQTYWSVEYVDAIDAARFATYGRGIWEYKRAINPLMSISNASEEENVMVYPNPTSSLINILVNTTINKASIEIASIHGEKIMQLQNAALSKNIPYKINCTGIAKGVYLIKVNSEKVKFTKKITIV